MMVAIIKTKAAVIDGIVGGAHDMLDSRSLVLLVKNVAVPYDPGSTRPATELHLVTDLVNSFQLWAM